MALFRCRCHALNNAVQTSSLRQRTQVRCFVKSPTIQLAEICKWVLRYLISYLAPFIYDFFPLPSAHIPPTVRNKSSGWRAQGRRVYVSPFADVDFRYHLYGCFRFPTNPVWAPLLAFQPSDSWDLYSASLSVTKNLSSASIQWCSDALPGDHAQKVSLSTKHEGSYPATIRHV